MMKPALLLSGVICVVLLVLGAMALRERAADAFEEDADLPAATSPPNASLPTSTEAHSSFLYGRVTTRDGEAYQGRLRWGADEEAFWGEYLNGKKRENPWSPHVPLERLPTERSNLKVLGFKLGIREREIDLSRPFMARFGDIAHIERLGRDVWVTLKSGTVFGLDRHSAGDFDDGVRVWDERRGIVDLESRRIRSIELLPNPGPADGSHRLHGRVRTRLGDFTGFIQWNREEGVGSDELEGRTADGELSLRFDTILSIAHRSHDSSLVTLRDGLEIVLAGTREVGEGNRGVYVDDARYGRVLIPWHAFERIDFAPGGGGNPAYEDFPPGSPLTGSVTTGDGRRLEGRLVYDLDESETTETLDAPFEGVHYTILFGRIASIEPNGLVSLHSGEELELERAGDLGETNAGILVFVDGSESPEYVPWSNVVRVDLDRPQAMYPPLDER